jgi:FkbM family methyltransferase
MKLLIKKSLTMIFNLFYKIINHFIPWIFDSIYERKIYISIPDTKVKISYRNFGPVTRWRANASLTKEKNTIKWINSFQKGSKFLDVGAHMGIFTLYAAKVMECDVVSVEPSAITFALLNLNISDNNIGVKVIPIPVAAGSKKDLNKYYFTSQSIDAGCGHPYDPINTRGEDYNPDLEQGIVVLKLDDIYEKYGPFDHIKIDIDGHEKECLAGSEILLSSKELKSLLIELNENAEEYSNIIEKIKSYNFILNKELTSESFVSEKRGSKIYNHIFNRSN